MGDKRKDGSPKPVYYLPEDLTSEELERYFQFDPPLTDEQLEVVRAWCKENITNFALIDDDYIFLTLKSEHEKFVEFWTEYNQVEEEQEVLDVEEKLVAVA